MRMYLTFLISAFLDFSDLLIQVIALASGKTSFKPVLAFAGVTESQTGEIRSVFAKKPCSATGGTA